MTRWGYRLALPPHGKGRPRAIRRGNHMGVKTPDATRSWEGSAAVLLGAGWRAFQHRHWSPALPSSTDRLTLDVPCSLLVSFVERRPQGLNRRKDPPGVLWCPKKPDVDNAAKSLLDALVMAEVIADDALVVELTARHLYAPKEPHEGPARGWCEVHLAWGEHLSEPFLATAYGEAIAR